MVAGKQTIFLLPETSGDLVKRARGILDFTHIKESKIVLYIPAPHACTPPFAYQLAPSMSAAPGCCPAHALHHSVPGRPGSPKLATPRQPAAGWSAHLQPWAQSAQLATGGAFI